MTNKVKVIYVSTCMILSFIACAPGYTAASLIEQALDGEIDANKIESIGKQGTKIEEGVAHPKQSPLETAFLTYPGSILPQHSEGFIPTEPVGLGLPLQQAQLFDPEMARKLLADLKFSEDQYSKISANEDKFAQSSVQKFEDLRILGRQVEEAMWSDEINKKKILQLNQKMRSLEAELRTLILQKRVENALLMSEEQRRTLRDFLLQGSYGSGSVSN